MSRRLFHFRGGLTLRTHKRDSTATHVEPAPLPKQLILPLQQHIGEAAKPVVAVGDKVTRGQLIAEAGNYISAPVHAPTSGRVSAITEHAFPHPSGLHSPCIIIDTDGFNRDRRTQRRHRNVKEHSPTEIREMIRAAGIVGLGGAGFPSHVKLDAKQHKIETLILNGAECEPFITCDEMLMREQAVEIVEGLNIMRYALGAKQCLIGIENNKPKAIEAIRNALHHSGFNDIELITVPTVYPAGGEKQLIQMLTGKEVPTQGVPIDINIVCHNVGTAYAVCRAVEHGEPLISRYVTVAGSVAKARNLQVLFGTPVTELIQLVGGNLQTLDKIIIGGPMMGYALHERDVPVIKTTNCVLVHSVISDVPLPSRDDRAMPCIRCGNCANACPVNLLPQQMYWHARAKELDKVQDYHLFDCIECGCCDYVCPAHIPLVQYFRFAKSAIWAQDSERAQSDIARQRHEFRLQRLEREKQERAERHKQKRQEVAPDGDAEKKKAAIQAALERVKAKQAAADHAAKNTDNLTPQQQAMIAEVEARRAKKGATRKDDA